MTVTQSPGPGPSSGPTAAALAAAVSASAAATAKHAEPADGAEPAESAESAEPAKPATPTRPTRPTRPTSPTKPTKPAKPAKASADLRADGPRDPVKRLQRLFDRGTCELLTPVGDSGSLAATGLVQGVRAVAHASDADVQDGALGETGCAVILAAYERALAEGCPIIGLFHSSGARLQEGVMSLHAAGRVFAAMTRASGRIPQISVVLGPAAGGAAYGPALTDIVILGPAGRIFVTGPDVVRSVGGDDADALRVGGPEPNGRRSGVVHVACDTDDAAYDGARRLAGMLGDQGRLDADGVADRDLARLVPGSAKRAYDVHPLVNALLDKQGVELHPRWAPNIVTTLGRFGGRTVGVVANNPLRLGGCLDAASAEKASRFVRMCDAFGVPLIVVVDVPGYLPGVGQEWDGVVRRGAKLLHAFAESVVPRVTLVTRKSYGGAHVAMNSSALGATRVLAWPTAEVAVLGAAATVRIIHRRRLAEAPRDARPRLEQELAAEHETVSGGLRRAVELGVIHEIVAPVVSRSAIARVIAAAPGGLGGGELVRGAHGNIPL